jgi:hypothetical protein
VAGTIPTAETARIKERKRREKKRNLVFMGTSEIKNEKLKNQK